MIKEKINLNNPITKEEKLIHEFVMTLKDATNAFVNLNKLTGSSHEMFFCSF